MSVTTESAEDDEREICEKSGRDDESMREEMSKKRVMRDDRQHEHDEDM